MDPGTEALVAQLGDPKSAKRRSAAKKLRKLGDPGAGPALLEALEKELRDRRTWETQYQMVMALGYCLYQGASDFLESLSHDDQNEVVRTAIGDALFRLSGGAGGDLSRAVSFVDRGDPELIHGAFQAMAMERVIPDDEGQARRLLDYACSLELGENDWAAIWLLRTVPGWPQVWAEPLIDRWSTVEFRRDQQIHGAVELARQRKYYKWSPL